MFARRLIFTHRIRRIIAAGITAMMVAGNPAAFCQTPDQFYKGRQLTLVVFSGAGSTYDIYARLLARHIGRHIPGQPTVIVQNMVGAGGLKLLDYLYRVAPKDGSVFGTIGRGLAFEPMLGENDINVDPLAFTWLGSMNRDFSLAMAWHSSPVKTFDDLKSHDLLVPGTGVGADSEIIPLAINTFAGTRFKIIEGYRDETVGALAMERGELDGMAYWSWSSINAAHPDWIVDKKVSLLFHTGLHPIATLPGLPSIRNLVANPIDRQALDLLLAREVLGRPFLAPPQLPPDRAAVLRSAFAATLNDPDLKQDAQQARLDTDLVSGEEADALLHAAAAAPPAAIDRLRLALGRK